MVRRILLDTDGHYPDGDVMKDFPRKIRVRNTGISDERTGTIFTTSGSGYEKQEYINKVQMLGILSDVLGGGMVIGRDPEGHGWQLLTFPGSFSEGYGDPEIVVQHEDWDTFLKLCEDYI